MCYLCPCRAESFKLVPAVSCLGRLGRKARLGSRIDLAIVVGENAKM